MRAHLPHRVEYMARRLCRVALWTFPPSERCRSAGALESAVLDAAVEGLQTRGWSGFLWTLAAETVNVVWAGLGMRVRAVWAEAGMRGGHVRTVRAEAGGADGRTGILGGWTGDVRLALRGLRRSPGFAGAALAVLALGIGTSTAIFSVVDGVLVRPLPYPEPDRLVLLWNREEGDPSRMIPIAGPDVAVFRERAQRFDGFAFVSRVTEATLAATEPTHARIALVTPDLFDLLGARAELGRTFVPDDAAAPQEGDAGPIDPASPPDAPSVPLVLSHGLWARTFGQSPDVLGRTVRVNGQAGLVVGVMPEDFSLVLPPHAGVPEGIDAWSPIRVDLRDFERPDGRALDQDSDNSGAVIARLAPGTTLERAQAEMDAIAADLRREVPEYRAVGLGVEVRSLRDDLTRQARPTLIAILVAGGFILLIACLNVALLVLARLTGRADEFAVRTALGAERRQVVRQITAENLTLGALGCGVGWLVATGSVELLTRLAPASLPRLDALGLDGRALAFAVAASVLASLVFGGLSGLVALRPSRSITPRSGARLGSRGHGRVRSALVVGEVALAVVLLATGGLLIRTVRELERVRPGFDPESVLTFSLSLRGSTRYAGPADRARFVKSFEERVEAIPGVEAVGLVGRLPLAGRTWTQPYGLPGQGEDRWVENTADFRMVTSGYFRAMGSRLLEGRSFTEEEDLVEERRVAVIDEVLALRLAPEGSAIGRRIGFPLDGQPVEAEVVGVVEHVRYENLKTDGREAIYVPYRQEASRDVAFAVRTRAEPETATTPIRHALEALDPDLTLYDVRPMPAYLRDSIAPTRFALTLVAGFGLASLVSTLVGLYGLIAYTVGERRREIGLRLAVGADGRQVLTHVVVGGMRLVGVGLLAGLALALAFGSIVEGLLFRVRAVDPGTLAAAAGLLFITAAVAIWLPARRAAAIDPASALRAE